MYPQPPRTKLFPYTTLFRSRDRPASAESETRLRPRVGPRRQQHFLVSVSQDANDRLRHPARGGTAARSEEHTSELQSQSNLVCRLLLEKKNKKYKLIEYIKS